MSSSLSTPPRVLFVDDDADVRKSAQLLLARHGFELTGAASPEEAWSALAAQPPDVVLLDLNFGPGAVTGAEGLRCLQGLVAHDADVVVIVVTGHSGIKIAVEAMRTGATDFVMKPWNNQRLVEILQDAVALRHKRAAQSGETETTEPFLAISPLLRQTEALATRAAATDAAVLILGEPGAGKSLLAQLIHRRSRRAVLPLITLDPATLWAEGEPALTTALAAIDPGATLCTEISAPWPAPLQARLLGFLTAHPAVRLIATSRIPPAALQGSLNADLYFRLATVEITLPPLRGHQDQIETLASHFLRLFARRHQRPTPQLSPAAGSALIHAAWPANVRELRQVIERAVVLAQQPLLQPADLLPPALAEADPGASDLNLLRTERLAVQEALKRHGFNVTRAARDLGLTRAALYRRMARHGL